MGDFLLSAMMAAKRKQEEEKQVLISVFPRKRIRSASSSSSSSSSSSPSASSSVLRDGPSGRNSPKKCLLDGPDGRNSPKKCLLDGPDGRNSPKKCLLDGPDGRDSPKKSGFSELVEIASLASAELNSLNILRKPKKGAEKNGCNAMLSELPKPNRSSWRYVHPGMEGVDFHVFLFERKLTKTDVNPSEARLFLNKKEVEEVLLGALTKREEELVFDPAEGLVVEVMDHLGYRYNTCLKFWHTVRQFALFKQWKSVVKRNQWVEGDVIRVWFFRYGADLKLGFLITLAEDDD